MPVMVCLPRVSLLVMLLVPLSPGLAFSVCAAWLGMFGLLLWLPDGRHSSFAAIRLVSAQRVLTLSTSLVPHPIRPSVELCHVRCATCRTFDFFLALLALAVFTIFVVVPVIAFDKTSQRQILVTSVAMLLSACLLLFALAVFTFWVVVPVIAFDEFLFG